eukprot:103556_1
MTTSLNMFALLILWVQIIEINYGFLHFGYRHFGNESAISDFGYDSAISDFGISASISPNIAGPYSIPITYNASMFLSPLNCTLSHQDAAFAKNLYLSNAFTDVNLFIRIVNAESDHSSKPLQCIDCACVHSQTDDASASSVSNDLYTHANQRAVHLLLPFSSPICNRTNYTLFLMSMFHLLCAVIALLFLKKYSFYCVWFCLAMYTSATSPPSTAPTTPSPTHYFGNVANCTSTCTSTKWVEISREDMGGQGTDEMRWLDFGHIYTQYSICNILQYKVEFNYQNSSGQYLHHVTFELEDSHKYHHIFEDTLGSIDGLIYINVLESTKAGLPTSNNQLFCKKCSSYDPNRPGNTCWGINPATSSARNCGCNDDGWAGEGMYYGGYMPGECNCRNCSGGGFSGWKNDTSAKGGIASWGVRISILVCDNVEHQDAMALFPTGGLFHPALSAAGWRECPEGYVMSGLYVKNCTVDLSCMRRIKCVTPLLTQTNETITQTCYNHSIGSSMTIECDSGYFVRGIWSDVGQRCGLDCWDTLRCCQFDENIIEYDTVSEVHDWSSCADGRQSKWCEVDDNEYMTGFTTTYDYWFNGTTTRHLTWSTIEPTMDPIEPTAVPTADSTVEPTSIPTVYPTGVPTQTPSMYPTTVPTLQPSLSPTDNPSIAPTSNPSTANPSVAPTLNPTSVPTDLPTLYPTTEPTLEPSLSPTKNASIAPTFNPSTANPTVTPTVDPTTSPTAYPTLATDNPTTTYPTLSTTKRRNFVLTLFGDYDALQQYLNDTNSSMIVWAKGVIQIMINITMYPQLTTVIITIHNVRRGSVLIDYSLTVDVISLLDLAEVIINSTVEVQTDGNFTLPLIANTVYTTNPTQTPTDAPTTKPSKSPLPGTMTHDPSPNPTLEPTTRMPTIAPTPQNVYCNQDGIATEIDSEYEYYLHIDEKSIVRFDTCETTNTFDMRIADTNSSANYSCVQCGSLCYTPSQYQVTLPSSIYVLHISGPHAFAMVCTPKVGTDAPTQYPTTTRPTTTPTAYPTPNPTTSRPTESDQPVFNVSFPGIGAPLSRFTFMGDPYGRFEASIQVTVVDKEDVLGVTALCTSCFIW